MSNSFKKSPFHGITTCRSERQDKKIWHAKFRRKEKQIIKYAIKINDIENHIGVNKKEVSNKWLFGKDGKVRYSIIDYYKHLQKYPDSDYSLWKYRKIFRK